MNKAGSKIIILALVMLGWIACGKTPPHLKAGYEMPEDTVTRYMDALRWKEFDDAKAMVAPNAWADFETFSAEAKKGLNIVDYKIRETLVTEEGYKATVLVYRSYYIMPSASQKEENITQVWLLLNGRWMLSGKPF